jgi:hypothetical protein
VSGVRTRAGAQRRVPSHALRSVAGIALVELLLAASIAMTTLAAAWPWFWTVAGVARTIQAESLAHSQAAYATRAIGEELRLSDGLAPVAPGLLPERSMRIRQSPLSSATDEVVIAWDPSRQCALAQGKWRLSLRSRLGLQHHLLRECG